MESQPGRNPPGIAGQTPGLERNVGIVQLFRHSGMRDV